MRAAEVRFRAEVLRRDPGARRWLDALPELQRTLGREWLLTATGPTRYGATAAVVPVDSPYGPSALKLISPVAAAAPEATALEAFGGDGAVRLLAADPGRNALLLDRLDGPDLTSHGDPEEMVRIAGGVARRLATATPRTSLPLLAEGAAGWRTQLSSQHATGRRGRGAAAAPGAVGDRPTGDRHHAHPDPW